MTIKELLENLIFDIISSALGVALVYYSFQIKPENSYWFIAFISGLIFQIPLFYVKLWKFIEEKIN